MILNFILFNIDIKINNIIDILMVICMKEDNLIYKQLNLYGIIIIVFMCKVMDIWTNYEYINDILINSANIKYLNKDFIIIKYIYYIRYVVFII